MHYQRNIPYESFALPGNPAAGALFTVTSPANELWEIVTVCYRFTAAAVVASRLPWLRLRNSAAALDLYRFECQTAITTGQTIDICWAVGVPLNVLATSTFWTLPLPANCITAVQTILEFGAHAMNGGDQISNIFYTYEKRLV